jgi:hypothetical protein
LAGFLLYLGDRFQLPCAVRPVGLLAIRCDPGLRLCLAGEDADDAQTASFVRNVNLEADAVAEGIDAISIHCGFI